MTGDNGQTGDELHLIDLKDNSKITSLKDINTNTSANPYNMVGVGNTLYFVADDGVSGYELWKMDVAGTVATMVKDIRPGQASAFSDSEQWWFNTLATFNGVLYFIADDGVHGREVWRSDGTAAGTTLLADIRLGSADTFEPWSQLKIVTNGNEFYFVADDGVHGTELWKSDGTSAGTMLVKDINPGIDYSAPNNLTTVNGILFFSATDVAHGLELWKSNGTAEGTVLVRDINPGSNGSGPADFTTIGNELLFFANDGRNGEEFWKSNGAELETVLVKDINTGANGSRDGSMYRGYAAFGNLLYFIASDATHGQELWSTNGTPDGTQLVKDINPGAANGIPAYSSIAPTAANGVLYFVANDGVNGNELWMSNGTEAGTHLVKDITAGLNANNTPYSTYFDTFSVFNSKFYFVAWDLLHGSELWTSDGTAEGTVLLKDIFPGPSSAQPHDFLVAGNNLFFIADEGRDGQQLWRSDGTPDGTVLVKNIFPRGPWVSLARATEAGNRIFFRASDGVHGAELWRSDGTAAGTALAADVNLSRTDQSSPYGFFKFKGATYFYAFDGRVNGLWRTDGTPDGTTLVAAVSVDSSETPPLVFGEYVYFSADDGMHGYELWRSDGTAAGTAMVKDIFPGTNGGYSNGYRYRPVVLNNILYFPADDGVHGEELWRSDGTEAGTWLVKDIDPGANGSSPGSESSGEMDMISFGGRLYFSAYDGTFGAKLWISDGTPEGTQLLKNITDTFHSYLQCRTKCFIVADKHFLILQEYGEWISDGTAAGTVPLKDLFASAEVRGVALEGVVGATIFLKVWTASGLQLWKTDGTSAGTELLKAFTESYSDTITYANVVGNTLYFGRSDRNSLQTELWKSDGTVAGTKKVKTLSDNTTNSNRLLWNFADLEQSRFFEMVNDTTGVITLWATDGTDAGTVAFTTLDATYRIRNAKLVGGKLYYTVRPDPNNSQIMELRVSDGTVAGSKILRTFAGTPNPDGILTVVFDIAIGETLYFVADDGQHGRELWKTDGTPEGTRLVVDLNLGSASSNAHIYDY